MVLHKSILYPNTPLAYNFLLYCCRYFEWFSKLCWTLLKGNLERFLFLLAVKYFTNLTKICCDDVCLSKKLDGLWRFTLYQTNCRNKWGLFWIITCKTYTKHVITPAVWDEHMTSQVFFLMLSILASVFGMKQPTHIVSGGCLWNTERIRPSRSCAQRWDSAFSCLVRINPIKAGRAIVAHFVRAFTSFRISFKYTLLDFLLKNVCLNMKMITWKSIARCWL